MKKDKFLAALVMTSCLFSLTAMAPQAIAQYSLEQEAEITLWTDYIKDYANDAFGYLNRANIHLDAREYANAIADYDAALKIDQYNTDAYVKRGNAKFQINDMEGALKDYAVALEINQKLPEARFNVGRVFYRTQDFVKAIQNMRAGIELDKTKPEYYFEIARAEYRAGAYKEAYTDFVSAINLNNEYTDSYYGAGLAAMNLSLYQQAVVAFSKVIESGQNYENAHYYKGVALYQLGQYELAIKDFDSAVQENAEDGMLYNYRGKAKEMLGEKSAAKKDYKLAKSFGVTKVGLSDEEKKSKIKDAEKVVRNVQQATEEVQNTVVQETNAVAENVEVVEQEIEQVQDEMAQNVEQVAQNVQETAEQVHEAVEQEVEETVEEVQEEVEQTVTNVEETANQILEYPHTPEEMEILEEEMYKRLSAEKIASGDIYSAVAMYDEVVQNDPTNSTNYIERANLKLEGADYDGAIRDAEMALRVGSDKDDAMFIQGKAYAGKGNMVLAYRALVMALRENPDNNAIRYEFAKVANSVGRFAEANEVLSLLISDESVNYSDLSLLRGKARYQLSEFYSSIADLTNYLEVEPKSADAYFYRAMSKNALKSYEDAITDFTMALKYDKKNTDYLQFRARAYLALGEYQKASNDYKKIVSIKGDSATTDDHVKIAALETYIGNMEEALIYFDSIVQKDNLNSNVFYERAKVYEKMGRFYDAINDYTRSLALDPDKVEIYGERGVILVTTKSYRKGILDLNEAIKFEPNNSKYYFYRAVAKESSGDHEGAVKDYAAAKQYENL